jgi:hypothetical protein
MTVRRMRDGGLQPFGSGQEADQLSLAAQGSANAGNPLPIQGRYVCEREKLELMYAGVDHLGVSCVMQPNGG